MYGTIPIQIPPYFPQFPQRRGILLTAITAVLACTVGILFILNIYQYLTQRAALRIADILYIMSRNVREKAAEVRRI
tara:strand:+ start:1019 stop:1249 length:231 start_codon:yes stop_codon:yes gene_type:complete